MDIKDYYTADEVKELVKDWPDFCNWMYGQTGPIHDGQFCYFTWDVERYLRHESDRLNRTTKDMSA